MSAPTAVKALRRGHTLLCPPKKLTDKSGFTARMREHLITPRALTPPKKFYKAKKECRGETSTSYSTTSYSSKSTNKKMNNNIILILQRVLIQIGWPRVGASNFGHSISYRKPCLSFHVLFIYTIFLSRSPSFLSSFLLTAIGLFPSHLSLKSPPCQLQPSALGFPHHHLSPCTTHYRSRRGHYAPKSLRVPRFLLWRSWCLCFVVPPPGEVSGVPLWQNSPYCPCRTPWMPPSPLARFLVSSVWPWALQTPQSRFLHSLFKNKNQKTRKIKWANPNEIKRKDNICSQRKARQNVCLWLDKTVTRDS